MAEAPRYSIVIPMYNEEAVIEETYRRLKMVMGRVGETYELLFINDGSSDRCAEMIREYAFWDSNVRLLELSRNFGQQAALTAGMDYAAGDAVILIAADLTDPPELILQMIARWKEGYEVVYAKRLWRKGNSPLKRAAAGVFGWLLRSDTPIPSDTGDFRLMDRKVVAEIRRLTEKHRYVQGMVSWVGFKQIAVEYQRDNRQTAGAPHYSLREMIFFSTKPLKLAGYLGALLSAAGFVYLSCILGLAVFTDRAVKGWTTLMGVTLLLDGVILLMIGILGDYLGRIYEDSKNRPQYILRDSGVQD